LTIEIQLWYTISNEREKEMPARRQIAVYFNQEQIQHIAAIEGIEITDGTSLKEAILRHYPDMPPDKPAGAPKRKPYQRKKKTAKGE
jgi:hypothetical protein